ncbi:hypothetical protein ON021_25850, partial [Microcoleus sp. HI-ES]|nr:hypothetical protein [Microcoleus sp. HI-ES]
STRSEQVPVPEVFQFRLLFFFNSFGVHHACQNTVSSIVYHCCLIQATAVPRRDQSGVSPE